ncbi:hypothetical protein HQQ94_02120 [Shewanella sp. VB17]|uniref:hypothetical protein n=1 Tax=Shewanella sp. VB17 TaxID=2739432 RepID=UPI001565BAF8|nr:hypothetical protein [Shewanella sp. VB17]NRD72057.1 hypothetical protein [Shewanella sp. VB17]
MHQANHIEENSNLEIYIDRATLPTIQQMTMIIANNSSHKKLIYWSRHPLTDQNILKNINGESCSSIDNIHQRLIEILSPRDTCHITIYGNTYWSKDIARLIRKISNIPKINIQKLELIDDGSSEYRKMYTWESLGLNNQIKSLTQGENNLKSYISGSENKVIRFLTGKSNKLPRSIGSIFNWHKLFPTTYHMLRMDYMEKPELRQLKEHLQGNTKQIRWDYISSHSFTHEQKTLFYRMINFKSENFNYHKKNSFMFIGVDSTTTNSDIQIRVISDSLSDQGVIPSIGKTNLLFKGHPFADFNDKIIDAHKMQSMNSSIPFETLIMAELLPQKIGGMESSLYFSLPQNYKIEYIVFEGTADDIEKNSLVQIMLYLNIITPQQIFFSNQFK